MINPEIAQLHKNTAPLLPEFDQRRASDPSCSVWVGASAGSGKTKVLADRVLRLLLTGVDPQKILCLTFTKAAAAEMSIRIAEQLARWATCSDEELRKDLDVLQGTASEPEQMDKSRRLFATVLGCPGGMRILTIHAFGQEILRRFPLEAGIPPYFTVLDEADAKVLWHEAKKDLLQTASALPKSQEGIALRLLVKELGEDSFDDILIEATKDKQCIKKSLEKCGGLEQMIALIRGILELAPDDNRKTILQDAVNNSSFPRKDILYAAKMVHEKGTIMFKSRSKKILDWLALSFDDRVKRFNDYTRAFLTDKDEPFKSVANKEILAFHPDIENIIIRETTRILSVLERLDAANVAEQTAAVLTLAVAMDKKYIERKSVQTALDYDDLIRRANELLHRSGIAPWVLFKLDGGIDHILVDEAQDTNPDQWCIIEILADEFFSGISARSDRNRTLFVVGDEKQSIFSFQGSDPDEFDRMRKHFSNAIKNAKKAYLEVPLNVSFRSAPAILRAVDAVFATESTSKGVSKTAVEHIAYRRGALGRVEVWPLVENHEIGPKSDGTWAIPIGYEPERNPAEELAEKIASQIKNWWKRGVTVYDRKTKQDRPMTPGDVMVLVQSRSAFVDHLVRNLKKNQVPVTGVDRMTLTKQLSVMDLMAVLQFALLQEDDLTLASVLRSPLLGCSEPQLMDLALNRKGSLWKSLNAKAETDEVYISMRNYLQRCLNDADKITPLAMLSRLLSEPCPADKISGRHAIWSRLGPDAQDPIDELLNAAQDFGARHTPSLQAFLHWLTSTETEIKRGLDQGLGRVRITTVHSSKGLEAPIVIIPDTVKVPDKRKLSKFLWHPEHEVPFYVPREPLNATLQRLRSELLEKRMEENRRLLYVAMTRAADKLYVCGWKSKQNNNFENSWYSIISTALQTMHEPSAIDDIKDEIPTIAFADTHQPESKNVAKDAFLSHKKDSIEIILPEWIYKHPMLEPKPPRPLVPSRSTEEEPPLASPDALRFARGRIIHRLLQSLPDVAVSKRRIVAERFLSNPQHNLTSEQQSEIIGEVMALLNHASYASLFAPESRAEVPIVALIGDKVISGQIDRLCVTEKEVWIVDYKTNRPPPKSVEFVPEIYRRQLSAYRAVLCNIYPDKTVRCFLLWTYEPRLMPIPNEILLVT